MSPKHGRHVHRTLKLGAKGADVRELQQGIKATFDHYEIDWPLRIDADYGHASKKAALVALYVMGASNRVRKKTRHEGMPEYAQQLLRGVKKPRFGRLRRRARRKHIRHIREGQKPKPEQHGNVMVIDGREVAGWIGDIVLKVRAAGRWVGVIVSGRRTPEYSRSLCRAMCGADFCPGRCAGTSSNHACPPTFTCAYPEGAVDVSDYVTFKNELIRLGLWDKLKNDLPIDPVHFSASGH